MRVFFIFIVISLIMAVIGGVFGDTADYWNNKGIALENLGQYEEAIKAYDKALLVEPEFSFVWNNKGRILHELGQYEEAIKAFDKALLIDPEYSNAWNNKGIALGVLGRYEEAIKAFDKTLLIDPNYSFAKMNRELALEYLNKMEPIPTSTPTSTPIPTTPLQESPSGSDLLIKNVFSMYDEDTKEIMCEIVIANTGAAGAGRFRVDYFIAPEPSLTPFGSGATILESDTVSGLDAGEERESRSKKRYSIPRTVADGIYYFSVFLDSSNDVPESDEDNNIKYDDESFRIGDKIL